MIYNLLECSCEDKKLNEAKGQNVTLWQVQTTDINMV